MSSDRILDKVQCELVDLYRNRLLTQCECLQFVTWESVIDGTTVAVMTYCDSCERLIHMGYDELVYYGYRHGSTIWYYLHNEGHPITPRQWEQLHVAFHPQWKGE